jgi:hypothetical protein
VILSWSYDWFSSSPRFIIHSFSSSPPLECPGDDFWNFAYKWKFFFPCHQVHAKWALNGGRRSYRGWSDDRGFYERGTWNFQFITSTSHYEVI